LNERFILEGVSILREILNDIHVKKKQGVLFKNISKGYLMPFLLRILETKGFHSKFNDLIMHVVITGKVEKEVNGEVGPYFCTYQGLRQEYPLSLLLFDLASDAFAIMVERDIDVGLLTGLGKISLKKVWASCKYVDDTILLLENDPCRPGALSCALPI
jgi:hypothetical protein